ncbi:hypothetical protein A2769_02360 [Candidatus Daviesbacteria bacterium RIFCSPHIGHO2_01_FULL_37_27]|nr:MAG: hypothetical protein A2769_02360 [Candidatus Daviesbacteria bacterium RIFCSPHIGHO2_01_FULL_37_27]OGE46301.1 MAG: hypothetical protein A3B39_03940 [Candidatus Daviesbacteria bacterium RIFCSPLOWO2_01_FULL_37_10]
MKKTRTVPKFKSIQEEAEFWDTHSTEDFPDFWEPVTDMKFSKNLVSVFEDKEIITLDSEIVKAVKKMARKKGIDTSNAANLLIREHLSEMKVI